MVWEYLKGSLKTNSGLFAAFEHNINNVETDFVSLVGLGELTVLRLLGQEGWELISVTTNPGIDGYRYYYFKKSFKRTPSMAEAELMKIMQGI